MLPRYGPGSLKVASEGYTGDNITFSESGAGLPNKKCSSCVYMSVVNVYV